MYKKYLGMNGIALQPQACQSNLSIPQLPSESLHLAKECNYFLSHCLNCLRHVGNTNQSLEDLAASGLSPVIMNFNGRSNTIPVQVYQCRYSWSMLQASKWDSHLFIKWYETVPS